MNVKRKLSEVVAVPTALYGAKAWRSMEYGSSREEEIKCNEDEVSEDNVQSNMNELSEK